MRMDIILIFIFAVISIGLVKGSCPSTCTCDEVSSGSRIFCNLTYLGRIPALPNDTSHLYLNDNTISTIKAFTFMNLPSLRYLILRNNKTRSLVSYTFINMTNLYQLELQNNEISTIEVSTFLNLPSLIFLYILSNKIRSIESNTFTNMPKLSNLYLSENNISDIEEHAFGNLTSLTVLALTGNPLNCDCSIFAFWSWLIERSTIGTTAKCSNGTLVTSLQSTVLDTCHPDNCQCFNGGKCVVMDYELTCDCIGQWTGTFCQESQCTSFDCGFCDCYIEPVNGTAQCLCGDRYVNYCPDILCYCYYK